MKMDIANSESSDELTNHQCGGGGEHGGCTTILTSIQDLKSQVNLLSTKVVSLESEKKNMEEDFGLKRAKLKELFLHKEEELEQERSLRQSAVTESEILKLEVQRLTNELNEAQSLVTIAHYTKENEIVEERRKCWEEIATLQHLLKETENESTSTKSKWETEMKGLRYLSSKLEAELNQLKREQKNETTSLGPGVLSAVTKTLARKVGSITSVPLAGTSNTASSVTSMTDESLEDSMKKAQEDVEVLRSLVVPLEEEIKALKDKLRVADAQLQVYQSKEAKLAKCTKKSELVNDFFRGKSIPEVVSELDEKLHEVSSDLEIEKASRADLEMYVTILNTQKTVLQEDSEKIRTELKNLCQLLEIERRTHNELKDTWQRANDQFLESQRLQMRDMQRIEAVLTQEQMQCVEDFRKEDPCLSEEEKAEEIMTVETEIEKSDESLKDVIIGRVSPSIRHKINNQEHQILNNGDAIDGLEDNASIQSLEVFLQSSMIESDLASLDGTYSLSTPRHEASLQRWSPEKLPSLTEAQYKALADMTPELDERKATLDWATSSMSTLPLPTGKRIVSDREWMLLQEEVRKARDKLNVSHESEINRLQEDVRELQKQTKILQKTCERYKEELARECSYRKEIEDKCNSEGEEYKKKVAELSRKLRTSEESVSLMQNAYAELQVTVQQDMRKLLFNRETVQSELNRLQQANDSLIGKHSISAEELQSEVINLPNTVEELQELSLKFREDLLTAKVAKDHAEETLKGEIAMVRDQVSMSEQEKQRIEVALTQEVDRLRSDLGVLRSLESEFESEKRGRRESERLVKDLHSRLAHFETRHQQIIQEMQRQLEDGTQGKHKLEMELSELRGRVVTLQQELDTSEAVQQDFVRLSQSLQVQLEKLRQEENEVRWQHEEDVDACGACKQQFNVARRKHHCRHCGHIFCSDCLSHIVTSGPQLRPAKVCDVCHTLLVKDTAPYFSTEVPQERG